MFTPARLHRAQLALSAATVITATLTGITLAGAGEVPAAVSASTTSTSPRVVSMAVTLVDEVTAEGATQVVGVSDLELYDLDQTQLLAQLNDLRGLGVTTLRIAVPWLYVQPTGSSTYDWTTMDNLIDTATSMGFSLTGDITGNPGWDGHRRGAQSQRLRHLRRRGRLPLRQQAVPP